MSLSNNSLLLGADAAAAGYQITRSLRFNSADSAYLNRVFSTPTTQGTFTFSTWIKRSNLSTNQDIFSVSSGSSLRLRDTDHKLLLNFANNNIITTTAVFRDPSAWMHIVWSCNGSSQTLYVNNVSVGTGTGTTSLFNSAAVHSIGRQQTSNNNYFDGYLADIHFIDGQALTPSSFGETDANGVWQPKAFSGSYGNNGFRLPFSDNSGTTSTTLGKDSAGSNDWTPTNFNVTGNVGNDSLVDSPTNYGTDDGLGGSVRGNYATFNPISTLTTVTLANGNIDYSSTTASQTAIATIGVSSSKWYWEVITTAGTTQTQVGVYGTSASTLYSLAANSTVYGIRFNADAGTLDRTSDGTNWTSIATSLTSGPYFPYFNNNGTTAKTVSVNFGQRPFAYTAPSGYKALCTQNLPTPTIAKPSTVMDTVLYTGTGATLTPTSSLGFSPDLVWIKSRSAVTDNTLYDTVRGAQARLESNTNSAEVTSDNGLTAFDSNGFTLGTLAQVNTNNDTYAAWCWDGGSSTVTNTNGTISSQVRANASAGFSVVTYTGTGSNASVGHGLNVAPRFVVINARVGRNWNIYHGTFNSDEYIQFSTAGVATLTTMWNNQLPTSTVFRLGTSIGVNGSTEAHVAYCWAPVAGYSSFGSYTGNGNADGPFVYLGFRPAVVIVKMSSSTGNWTILDDKREGYNVDNDPLFPNLVDAEGTTDLIDITSNGFKVRTIDATFNTNTGTYIYAAWAANPFQYSRAR